MPSTNKTSLGLSQFVGSDIPDWLQDYNADMRTADSLIAGRVPQSRTVNGYDLSEDRALTVADVGGSNPNLLDNWYFAGPVDQRAGYVVPPDTPYYSDTALAAQSGTVGAYTTAVNVDNTYGVITVDGTTYYAPWSAAVRGYVGPKYTIDRWQSSNRNLAVLLVDNGISLVNSSSAAAYLRYYSEMEFPTGTYTMSVLLSGVSGTVLLQIIYADNTTGPAMAIERDGLLTYTFDAKKGFKRFNIQINASSSAVVTAAKLEPGPVQTLARQEADGSWALSDPPPHPAAELAKCQRYQLVLRNSSASLLAGFGYAPSAGTAVNVLIPTPVPLRARPSVTWDGTLAIYPPGEAGNIVTAVGATGFINPNGVFLSLTTTSEVAVGGGFSLRVNSGDTLLLDANL